MELISILNIVIAFQALFLSIHFILKSKGAKLLNRLLAFLCFAFAIIAFNTYLSLAGVLSGSNIIQDIANNVMWFIGPALYMYTIYKDKAPDSKLIAWNTLPYILPAAIDLFFDWNWFYTYIPIVAFLQMGIYLFLSLRYIVTVYSKSSEFYAWILPSIVSYTILVAVNCTFIMLRLSGIELLTSAVLQSFTSLLAIPVVFLAYKEMNSIADFGIHPKKYKTTHLSEDHLKTYLDKIDRAMKEEELFLQKSLTLAQCAQHLDIQSKYISQAINQHKQMSFSEYVAQFRLEKVKKELVNSENKHLTIFGIAQQCGFNSNSRFSHLFKKHTGLTAKQYQDKHRQ